MNTRVVLLMASLVALAGAALAIARSDAQTADPTLAITTSPNATTMPAEDKKPAAEAKPATEPAPPTPEKTVAVTPPAQAHDQAPAASAAPTQAQKPAAAQTPTTEPAPVVATPRLETEKPAAAQPTPVVTAPPPTPKAPVSTEASEKQKTTPIVSAPEPTPEQPTASKPAKAEPTPVVTAPEPAQVEKPAVATEAPAEEPKPVVAAPTPTPKPVVVETPLPRNRPRITKAYIERTRPAKYLFGAAKLPSAGHSRAIGYYPKGCLAGGVELPVDGTNWQVMRLSRNRNWGHPELVRFLERFAPLAAKATGWPGILVGDMSQPRGGPLPYGHRSHQVGLDVDIWFRPMPDHRLSRKQRNTMSATHLVKPDGKHLNPKTWSTADAAFIRTAAEQPEVERVLVNAVIKKELCRLKGKQHWSWMAKVRPWYGHDDHIHVRLKCPANSPHCRHQPAVPGGAGCSKKALAFWFSDRVLHPKPPKHPKPRKQMMLADMPAACKVVLNAPAKKSRLASEERR